MGILSLGEEEVSEEDGEQVAEDELMKDGVRVEQKNVSCADSLTTGVESVQRRTAFVRGAAV